MSVKATFAKMTVSGWYHVFWFSVIALAIGMEGWAIARHGSGFTLSEWVWSKIRTPGMRMLVGAFLTWLIWHFLYSGPGKGLRYLDLTFVIVGAGIGLASIRYGWH